MTTARLSGPQKAAALMLALDEDQAAALFGRLHEDEIRDLSAAMASLGTVPAATGRGALPRVRRGARPAPATSPAASRAPSGCC